MKPFTNRPNPPSLWIDILSRPAVVPSPFSSFLNNLSEYPAESCNVPSVRKYLVEILVEPLLLLSSLTAVLDTPNWVLVLHNKP